MESLLEYKLDKDHVAQGSCRNGKKHLPSPEMEADSDTQGEKFRQTVVSCHDRDILKTVDNKHAEYSHRQCFSKIADKWRNCLARGEYKEGESPGQYSSSGAQCYGDDLLSQCHSFSPACSMGFLNTVQRNRMHTIVGIMKELEPKISRQTTAESTPNSAV